MQRTKRLNWCLAAALVATCGLAMNVRASEPPAPGDDPTAPHDDPPAQPETGDDSGSGGSETGSSESKPRPLSLDQFLELMRNQVRMQAGLAGNQMWSLLEAIKAGRGGDALPDAGSELGSQAAARLDQIAADGKARVDQLIGGILSQIKPGGDTQASFAEALKQMMADGEAAIDQNNGYAHTALMQYLAGAAKLKDPPKSDKPSGDAGKSGDKPKASDGAKVKGKAPAKAKPKPKPKAKRKDAAGPK